MMRVPTFPVIPQDTFDEADAALAGRLALADSVDGIAEAITRRVELANGLGIRLVASGELGEDKVLEVHAVVDQVKTPPFFYTDVEVPSHVHHLVVGALEVAQKWVLEDYADTARAEAGYDIKVVHGYRRRAWVWCDAEGVVRVQWLLGFDSGYSRS